MYTLAINRRFLYVGLFLVALGGVLIAVDVSAVDSSVLSSATVSPSPTFATTVLPDSSMNRRCLQG